MKSLLSVLLSFLPVVLWGQIITTVVGNGVKGYAGDGGAAIMAQLNEPAWIVFDKYDNLYFSDAKNNVIRKVSAPSGIISTIVGTGATGYSGDGGPATDAKLRRLTGFALDTVGNIYIADLDNHVIRKVNTSGIITTFAGTGIPGYSGDGGSATAAKLNLPYSIIIDHTGNVYISDANNYCVRRINTSGIISTIAGNGTIGYSGDSGPATNAQLKYPGMLAIHPLTNDIYIPDYSNSRIRKVDALGIITTIAGNGTIGNGGDGGLATDAQLNAPNAINFDDTGNFYISNNYGHVIRKVDTFGIITTIAGIGTQGFSGDGGPATLAELYRPNCAATDKWGNIYIADVYNNRIRRITYNTAGVTKTPHTLPAIAIHPNPATTELTINTPTEIKDIAILDIMGREVISHLPNPEKREVIFSVAHLPPGMYFVKVNGVYAGKFVKE